MLFLALTASSVSSCTGDAGDCDPQSLTPVEGIVAAERATSCAPTVELDGIEYMQWGCPPVRRALLGSVVGQSPLYVTRSIEGVPADTALAVHERPIQTGHGGAACGGWSFWADPDLIDSHRAAVDALARSVNRTGTLE